MSCIATGGAALEGTDLVRSEAAEAAETFSEMGHEGVAVLTLLSRAGQHLACRPEAHSAASGVVLLLVHELLVLVVISTARPKVRRRLWILWLGGAALGQPPRDIEAARVAGEFAADSAAIALSKAGPAGGPAVGA